MRRAFFALAAALSLAVPLLSGTAAAQKIPAPIILVVDTNRIMAESKAMKSIRDQIERVRGSFQTEIKREEDELRRADQEIGQQRQLLSPEALNQRRQELQQRAAQLQVKARTRRSQLDQALRTAVNRVRETLITIVQGVAQRNGSNMVIQKADLVFADPRMEVTDEVLRQLDQQLSSVKVEMPRG